MSENFVCGIHCVKEHDHVDFVVPLHNNIDMTMTNKEQFAVILIHKKKHIISNFIYHGIYRDDGFIIMNGRKTKKDMNEWLISFQNEVNKIAESDCLIFTAKIWDIADDKTVINNKLTVVNDKHFPYLDMEMYWNERKELKFQVHMKPNQKIKYLNSDSTHMPSTFRAIPNGVLGRLSK